jgi:hypothetical protein
MLCGQGISMNEMPVMMTMMVAKRNNNPTWAGSGDVSRLLPLKMGLYIEKYARSRMGSRWILERSSLGSKRSCAWWVFSVQVSE